MDIDITGALEHLVTVVAAALPADVRNVSADPAELRLPGVLVQFAGLDLDTLQGYTVQARLLLLTGDAADPKVIKAWDELASHVLDADVEVTGVITAVPVTHPAHEAPMPGLSIPVNVHMTEE